jgi:RNA polymerase sigma-70 factor (ECF subfamily)
MSHTTTWQDDVAISGAHKAVREVSERVERSDLQLVELVLAGDDTAFEDIFERHKRLVTRVAARYFRRPEEVEEIVQIAFAKVYFELKNFRGVHELSLTGWLARITANACLDRLRSQKRRPEDLACDLPDADDMERLQVKLSTNSGEQAHIDRDLAAKLLARLPNEDRILLEMLYLDEFSTAEAAAALGWTTSTIKVRAWRARKSLQRILKRLM